MNENYYYQNYSENAYGEVPSYHDDPNVINGRTMRKSSGSSLAPSTNGVQPKAQKQSAAPKNRKDNSLNKLTVRFMELISSSESGIVDLNTASVQLNVQKRRIYDITNVLEGIGLIEKKSKNNIVWKGDASSIEVDSDVELAKLEQEDLILDQLINERRNELKSMLEYNSSLSFLAHDDIRQLESMQDQTVIAVRASTGTRLEVPDPDAGLSDPSGKRRRYQIFLKSDNPIDVYLVSQMEEDYNESEMRDHFQQTNNTTLTQQQNNDQDRNFSINSSNNSNTTSSFQSTTSNNNLYYPQGFSNSNMPLDISSEVSVPSANIAASSTSTPRNQFMLPSLHQSGIGTPSTPFESSVRTPIPNSQHLMTPQQQDSALEFCFSPHSGIVEFYEDQNSFNS
eukprot:TRINITY_DN12085_c0_g1_i1.p1 TRINITY_DN12085_c0_g1~~TRINITY_DN12085_c0_g1_i1.p1  ORF type:complete len:396 (-),score=62.65 TRINITY_DN12085_c0_g1_i1:92-1279(-)